MSRNACLCDTKFGSIENDVRYFFPSYEANGAMGFEDDLAGGIVGEDAELQCNNCKKRNFSGKYGCPRKELEDYTEEKYPYKEEWNACEVCGTAYGYEEEECRVCGGTTFVKVDIVFVKDYISEMDWETAGEMLGGKERNDLISQYDTHILVDRPEWAEWRKEQSAKQALEPTPKETLGDVMDRLIIPPPDWAKE